MDYYVSSSKKTGWYTFLETPLVFTPSLSHFRRGPKYDTASQAVTSHPAGITPPRWATIAHLGDIMPDRHRNAINGVCFVLASEYVATGDPDTGLRSSSSLYIYFYGVRIIHRLQPTRRNMARRPYCGDVGSSVHRFTSYSISFDRCPIRNEQRFTENAA